MLTKTTLLVGCTVLFSHISLVHAHGYLTTPKAEFTSGSMPTTYITTFAASFEGKFDGSPQDNVDNFNAAFKSSGIKSLREFLKDKGSECGNSNSNASPKPIPQNGKIVWQNPDTGEGFVPSHMGPCEAWLDDTLVFSNENCAGNYPAKPAAELPVDFSSCTGNCMLRFYWLALHEPQWQVYKNCVPLSGSGAQTSNEGGSASPASGQSEPTAAPSTPVDEYSDGDSYNTPAMTPTPEATQVTTSSPAYVPAMTPVQTPAPQEASNGNYASQGVTAFSAEALPTVYNDLPTQEPYEPAATTPTPTQPTKKPCF